MLDTERSTTATVLAVYETPDDYLVQVTAPLVCETGRDFSNLTFLLLPAGELPINSEVCEFGECAPYPAE